MVLEPSIMEVPLTLIAQAFQSVSLVGIFEVIYKSIHYILVERHIIEYVLIMEHKEEYKAWVREMQVDGGITCREGVYFDGDKLYSNIKEYDLLD